jgi:hypothetical protein
VNYSEIVQFQLKHVLDVGSARCDFPDVILHSLELSITKILAGLGGLEEVMLHIKKASSLSLNDYELALALEILKGCVSTWYSQTHSNF